MQNAPFTIKHVTSEGGVNLHPAAAVAVIPQAIHNDISHLGDRGVAGPAQRVEFDNGSGDGVRAHIETGVVYVMNQNGRTVDTIHLPLPEAGPSFTAEMA